MKNPSWPAYIKEVGEGMELPLVSADDINKLCENDCHNFDIDGEYIGEDIEDKDNTTLIDVIIGELYKLKSFGFTIRSWHKISNNTFTFYAHKIVKDENTHHRAYGAGFCLAMEILPRDLVMVIDSMRPWC